MKIPSTVFFPPPKIDACCVTIDFTRPHPALLTVDGALLRAVIITAFGKRRKMMRQSLKGRFISAMVHGGRVHGDMVVNTTAPT
jgi:16S rRNA A1518/A1519 N6-dimethyltransferase RsmA/KsgA/DIM1 with predicted DNA glycosylase/AP lyase activity